ncbi:MAG: hypothetical protein WCB14_21295 [Candidatus Acidiferrales bacterium]
MLLRLFFLVLSLVSVYTLLSASHIMMRLRSLTNRPKVGDASSLRRSLAALRIRSANMRQLVGASFYLFGFIFFLSLPWATVTLDNSRMPVLILILRNFLVRFDFAANVFSVFVVLHSVQWFVSRKVNAYTMHLNAQNVG